MVPSSPMQVGLAENQGSSGTRRAAEEVHAKEWRQPDAKQGQEKGQTAHVHAQSRRT